MAKGGHHPACGGPHSSGQVTHPPIKSSSKMGNTKPSCTAINKDGKTGGGGWEKGRGRRKEAVQFSALGLAVESKRRVKMEMWLKGTEEGTATRVIRVCVPALMDLLLAVSEC